MRVIHVVPSVAKESSGPSYSVVRLGEAMEDHGQDVTIATLDWGTGERERHLVRAFPIGWLPKRLGNSPAMKRWLRRQCEAGGRPVVHNHGMWQFNALYPSWVGAGDAGRARARLVHSPRGAMSEWSMRHGSRAKRVFWPLLQLPALRAVHAFHATAWSEYEEIRALGFGQPVIILPNGVDVPELPDASDKPERRKLLFLGRLHPKKGLECLLEAWADVERAFPHWDLDIVGSDVDYYGSTGYRGTLEHVIRKRRLSRVYLRGALEGKDKRRAFVQADLFVLPTKSENFGLAVAEALSFAVPAIVTTGAPWSGLRTHGCGWWIDQGAGPLEDCLREAMALPRTALEAMGASGRAWMRREFAWRTIGERMLDAYRWLDGSAGAPPPWVAVG